MISAPRTGNQQELTKYPRTSVQRTVTSAAGTTTIAVMVLARIPINLESAMNLEKVSVAVNLLHSGSSLASNISRLTDEVKALASRAGKYTLTQRRAVLASQPESSPSRVWYVAGTVKKNR
jgi:hypothetical protein